ncbi:MAG TPA: (d)CMP kinase [Prolixibacteraceae bacterium]|nr:(d)CMP kinase [Prolixibacteraceae bacterium]
MANKKIVIAIDGFSSCGKSTVAKSLARRLGYAYIDSGAMYRAVTLFALRNNLIHNGKPDKEGIIRALGRMQISFSFDPETEKNITFLNGENIENEIRRLEVSENVSPVSAIADVRRAMVDFQREMGRSKGIVMDGRDIGTVVFPDAELKIFMTADPEIRAQRRYLELVAKGESISMEEIRKNIGQRDFIDQNRKESPLRKADDALVLDNSYLTPDQQLQWAIDRVKEITENHES